jgi:hypothetical protein
MPVCTYALACMTMSLTTVTIVVIQLIASAVTIPACQNVSVHNADAVVTGRASTTLVLLILLLLVLLRAYQQL